MMKTRPRALLRMEHEGHYFRSFGQAVYLLGYCGCAGDMVLCTMGTQEA